jgi:hypothetical protein
MNCVFAVGLALIRSSFDYSPGVSEIEQCLLRRCAINIDCDLNLNAGSNFIWGGIFADEYFKSRYSTSKPSTTA